MTAALRIDYQGAHQQALPFQRKLYVDLLAGAGGGSSSGARMYRDPIDLVLLGEHALVDFTLRMLKAPDRKLAQDFSSDYILDRGLSENEETGQLEWRSIEHAIQIRLIGNNVSPDEAEDLIAANAKDLIDLYQQEAA